MNIPSNLSTYLDPKTFLGMTLRDYFAAAAMQAIAVESLKVNAGDLKLLTKNAYFIADEMIEARK